MVDDGIVIAENIFRHYEQGKTPEDAAIDGTMEVIDNVKKHINKVVNLIITSVIQTPTGRMIFSKVADLRDQDNSITGVK